ncbi:MAG: nicotinate-nucleotide--dimethylbenzimidazole phosphoribosyltransferase [Desulfonatronovibrionaceae bacterium]
MLSDILSGIVPVDRELLRTAQSHLDNLTKPEGSLGLLEEIAARLVAISNGQKPCVQPGLIYTCAGDHGVASAGVSLYPGDVTRQMVMNFMNKGAAVNVLAHTCGLELKVVDVGVCGEQFPEHELLVPARICSGTEDLSRGPAMTEEDCRRAVDLGIDLAVRASERGIRTLCTGEMGIGNTTPSTALFCALLGFEPLELAGAGTGLSPEGIEKKALVIRKGLEVNRDAVAGQDPMQILAALGGLEIACLTGIILGGAWKRMNLVVDGFISTAAFVCAWKINAFVQDYAFFSHLSAEKGHGAVLDRIRARPILNLGMRLGEGTGAAMGYHVLRCAADLFNNMATFEQARVSRQTLAGQQVKAQK